MKLLRMLTAFAFVLQLAVANIAGAVAGASGGGPGGGTGGTSAGGIGAGGGSTGSTSGTGITGRSTMTPGTTGGVPPVSGGIQAPGRHIEQHIHGIGERARSMERSMQDLGTTVPQSQPPVGGSFFSTPPSGSEPAFTGPKIYSPSELQGKPYTLDELRKRDNHEGHHED